MTHLEDIKCTRHPKYDGKQKPRNRCDFCWYFYWTLHEYVRPKKMKKPVGGGKEVKP